MTKPYFFLLIAPLLLACESGSLVLTDRARESVKRATRARGQARIILFKDCLRLSAHLTRLHNDNVAQVVDSCSLEAHFMTRYLP